MALGWLQLAVSYLTHVAIHVNRSRVQFLEGRTGFGGAVAQGLGESARLMREQEGRVEVVVFAMYWSISGDCL